jgi:hypothetical protein
MEKAASSAVDKGSKPKPGDTRRQKSESGVRLFFDTSALVKRYIAERGSDDVLTLCAAANDVAISTILPVEFIATLSRYKRERRLDGATVSRLKKSFFADIADMTVILLSSRTITHASALVESLPLKTLDALHVGCALEYKPDLFVSADQQQLNAAKHIGLSIKQIPIE